MESTIFPPSLLSCPRARTCTSSSFRIQPGRTRIIRQSCESRTVSFRVVRLLIYTWPGVDEEGMKLRNPNWIRRTPQLAPTATCSSSGGLGRRAIALPALLPSLPSFPRHHRYPIFLHVSPQVQRAKCRLSFLCARARFRGVRCRQPERLLAERKKDLRFVCP